MKKHLHAQAITRTALVWPGCGERRENGHITAACGADGAWPIRGLANLSSTLCPARTHTHKHVRSQLASQPMNQSCSSATSTRRRSLPDSGPACHSLAPVFSVGTRLE